MPLNNFNNHHFDSLLVLRVSLDDVYHPRRPSMSPYIMITQPASVIHHEHVECKSHPVIHHEHVECKSHQYEIYELCSSYARPRPKT